MGVAFTGEEVLNAALEDLVQAGQIRYAGYDEEDAIGHCYEVVADSTSSLRRS